MNSSFKVDFVSWPREGRKRVSLDCSPVVPQARWLLAIPQWSEFEGSREDIVIVLEAAAAAHLAKEADLCDDNIRAPCRGNKRRWSPCWACASSHVLCAMVFISLPPSRSF